MVSLLNLHAFGILIQIIILNKSITICGTYNKH